MALKVDAFAAADKDESGALKKCVGFIFDTGLRIAKPGDSGMQVVVYNGHKRKHALKFEAVWTPDGKFEHVYGPVKG